MTPRAILFDKDGTLVDLVATWVPAYMRATDTLQAQANAPGLAHRLLRSGGYDPDTDTLAADSLLSCGSNAQIVACWQAEPELQGTDIGPLVLGIFREFAVHHPVPVTDLQALFRRLRARDMRIGVATMDGTEAARACLDTLGLQVDFAIGHDGVERPKPAPDMALAFLRAVEVAPEHAVMVGDALKDLQMAKAAGFGLRVGVLTGAADRAALEPHANVVLDSIAQLETVL